MRRCVVLYNSADDVNISLLVDDKLVLNCVGNYSLDRFLLNTKINELDVIYKPYVSSSVPENGYKIGNFFQDFIGKVCVISNDDVNNLVDASRMYKIPNLKVYNYLDIIADKFKNHDKVIVLSEWSHNIVALVYLEYGQIVDFKKSNLSKLTLMLSRFREKYRCDVLEDLSTYNYMEVMNSVCNIKDIDSHKKLFISHLPYVLENKGVSLLDQFTQHITNVGKVFEDEYEDIDDKTSSSTGGYVKDFIKRDDKVISEDETPIKPKKQSSNKGLGGFFGKLFGKKRGKSEEGFDFSSYDDDYEQALRMESDRYLAQGYTDIPYRPSRSSVVALTKTGPMDYIFYAVMTVLVSCILLGTIFGAVYKGKLSYLRADADFLSRTKNQRQLNLTLAEESHSSPASNVAELVNISLPESYELDSVSYTGDSYKVNINSLHKNDSLSDVKKSLPSDFVVSDVSNNGKDSKDSRFVYALTLVRP